MNYYLTKIFKILFLACIVLCADISASSPQESSPIENLFPNIYGTEKIDSLNDYAARLDNDKSKIKKQIAEYSLDLSIDKDYNFGMIQALQSIGESYKTEENRDSSIFYLKKAFRMAQKINDRKSVLNISKNIGDQYSSALMLDSSVVYHRVALGSATILKDSLMMAGVLNSIGVTYWRQGKFNSALKLSKKSLEIFRALKKQSQVFRSLNNIGASYYQLGNKKIALEYYIAAEQMKESIDSIPSPLITNNIGLVNLELNDTAVAREYFNRGLKIAQKLNHKLGIGYSYFNLGDLYYRQRKYNLALQSYRKAEGYYTELNDINGIVKICNLIGQVYLKQNKYKLSEDKFNEAYELSKKHGLIVTQIKAATNISKILILRGNYIDAENMLIKALKLANQEQLRESIVLVYNQLVEVNKMQKDFKTALAFHEKYCSLKDSLFNEHTVRINVEAKEKYEAQQVEDKNIYLQNINTLQQARLEKQASDILQIVAGIIFLSIVVLYLIYLTSVRKRQNKELLKAKEQVDLINAKLNKTNELLAKSNSSKDRFFSIIAHDLKNPFNTLLGASQILNTDDGSLSYRERAELIEIIANDTQKLYSLLENLLYWSRSQTGSLKANKVKINLKGLVAEVVQLYKSSLDKKNINCEIEIPEEYFILFDEFMFSTIIRNLLSNAIKFSYSDGKIKFSATEVEEQIVLSIEDEGMGISLGNLSKLFDESSDFRGLGTENEKGTGLGLILCKEFASENNATINAESSIEEGTSFKLVLVKAKQ